MTVKSHFGSVLNNFYFRSLSLLKFLLSLVYVFLQFKNSRSRKTNGNNFRFSYESSSDFTSNQKLTGGSKVSLPYGINRKF